MPEGHQNLNMGQRPMSMKQRKTNALKGQYIIKRLDLDFMAFSQNKETQPICQKTIIRQLAS